MITSVPWCVGTEGENRHILAFPPGKSVHSTKEPPTEGRSYKINLKPLKLHQVLFFCLFAVNSTCQRYSILLVLTSSGFMDCFLILLLICAVHEGDRTKLAPLWPVSVPGNEGMRAPAMRVSQHCSFGHWTPLILPYTGKNSEPSAEQICFVFCCHWIFCLERIFQGVFYLLHLSREIRHWIQRN